MEAEAQRCTPRHATYLILLDPEDPMHPIDRLVKGMDSELDFPAVFTLCDPQDGKVFDLEIPGLTGTFEDGGFALHGTIPPGVSVSGRLNTEADDEDVIGTLQLKPIET